MHDRWTMLLHKQGARAPHGPEHGSRQPENEEQKRGQQMDGCMKNVIRREAC